MARIECGFTCKDCLSFEKCSYDAYKAANLNGKSEQNLISIANRNPCKFFKNKEDYEKVRHGEWLPQRLLGEDVWDCSECKTLGSPLWERCPICGSKNGRKG